MLVHNEIDTIEVAWADLNADLLLWRNIVRGQALLPLIVTVEAPP